MKKAIVFAFALLTSTIVPSIALNDSAMATINTEKEDTEQLKACFQSSQSASPTPIDGVYKIDLKCFFSTGNEGVKTPEPLVAKPDRFRLEIRYNPEEKRLEVPLFHISF
jgi:hypothetical protein